MKKQKKSDNISINPIQVKTQPSKFAEREIPISSSYPVIDTDLARDNIENDLTSSDLQDLYNSDGRHKEKHDDIR